MEERAEAFDQRFVGELFAGATASLMGLAARLRLATRERGFCASGGGLDFHERVDGEQLAVAADDQRIEIDRHDARSLDRELAESHEHVGEHLGVDLRFAAERLGEQMTRVQTFDHRLGVGAFERRHREDDVAERLGEDAAEAEQHAGTEVRIAHQAAISSRLPRTISATSSPTAPSSGLAFASSSAAAASHGGRVAEAEADEVALGLVGDRVAAQFHDHREAELGGDCRGFGGVLHDALRRDRNAVARDELLRLVLGEGVTRNRRDGVGHGGRRNYPPRRDGAALLTIR